MVSSFYSSISQWWDLSHPQTPYIIRDNSNYQRKQHSGHTSGFKVNMINIWIFSNHLITVYFWQLLKLLLSPCSIIYLVQFSSVAQSCPTLCNPMNRTTPGLPYPSPTPGVYPNSCPLSRWCHSAISSYVIPFSSCPQSLPASESFPMSQLFASGGQSIRVQLQHQFFQWTHRTDLL